MRRTPLTSRYNYNHFTPHFDDSPRDHCADAPTCAALHRTPRRGLRHARRPCSRIECDSLNGWDPSASSSDDASPLAHARFVKKRSRWRSPHGVQPQQRSTARDPWMRQQPMVGCWATSSPEPKAFGALYPCARCGHQDPFGVDELKNEYSRRFKKRAPCCEGNRCETLLERVNIQQELCRIEREQCSLMRQQYMCDQMKLNLEREKWELAAHQQATHQNAAVLEQQQQKDGIFQGVASKLVQIMNDYVDIIPDTENHLGFKLREAAYLNPPAQPLPRPCTMTTQKYAHPKPLLWKGLANNHIDAPRVHQPACTHPACTHPVCTHPACTHPECAHPACTPPACTHVVPKATPQRNARWQIDAPLSIAVSGTGRAYSPPCVDIPILRHTNQRGVTLDPRPGPMRQCDLVRSAVARGRSERKPVDPGRWVSATDEANNEGDPANVWSSHAQSVGVQIGTQSSDARKAALDSPNRPSGSPRSHAQGTSAAEHVMVPGVASGGTAEALKQRTGLSGSTGSRAKAVSMAEPVKVPRVASTGTAAMRTQQTATAQSDESHDLQSWRKSQEMNYKSSHSRGSADLLAHGMARTRRARRKARMTAVAQLGDITGGEEPDTSAASAGAEPEVSVESWGAAPDINAASVDAEPEVSAASVGAEPCTSAASVAAEPYISAASVGAKQYTSASSVAAEPHASYASGKLALPPAPSPAGGRRRQRKQTLAAPVMGLQRDSDGEIISPEESECQEDAADPNDDDGAGIGWLG